MILGVQHPPPTPHPQITQLKIAANPFAKGFRENGRNCKRWASFTHSVVVIKCLLCAGHCAGLLEPNVSKHVLSLTDLTNTYLVPAYVPGTVLGSEDAEQTKAPALMELIL